ncbi:MAG TPA: nuclease A inhibitor family protein [Adhaeribacter sp.]|nr:nuclease A inhibitor family protein [Adhaeribacter sp.]
MEKALDKLRKASEGLYFLSESDYPFETVAFPAEKMTRLNPFTLLQQLGLPENTPVEEQKPEYFFRNMTRELPEYGPEEKANAQRFRDLEKLLIQTLEDVKVYRVGQIQVDAYIVGRLPEGGFGGLKTTLIET